MTLGNCWLIKDDTQARARGERVFRDMFWGIENMDAPGSANSMSNRDTMSEKEVLATLSGFQYQESQRSLYLELLKSDISNHLLSKLPQDNKTKTKTPAPTVHTSLMKPQSSTSYLKALSIKGNSAHNNTCIFIDICNIYVIQKYNNYHLKY
jgi:hypothetical protein